MVLRTLLTAFTILCTGIGAVACVDSINYEATPVQCNGLRNGKIEITAVYGGNGPYYFSIDNQSFSTRPVFESLWAGVYTIYVRDGASCLTAVSVLVPEPEELKVKLFVSDTEVPRGQFISLKIEVVPENAQLAYIEWRPPYLFPESGKLTQSVMMSETTNFAVEIMNTSGCVARDYATVSVKKTNVFIPSAIQPGSNQNAYFTVFADEGVRMVKSLSVFNRSGALVFERQNFLPNDPLRGWNGRQEGARFSQPGVYLYLARIEYLDGKDETIRGSVTVVN